MTKTQENRAELVLAVFGLIAMMAAATVGLYWTIAESSQMAREQCATQEVMSTEACVLELTR